MEIEGSVIRLSPEDVYAVASYARGQNDASLLGFAESLEHKLDALGQPEDDVPSYKLPILVLPYARHIVDAVNAAVLFKREQVANEDQELDQIEQRARRAQQLLARREGLNSGKIVRLKPRQS